MGVAASTGAAGGTVFIKRTGTDRFSRVKVKTGDAVADLAKRASSECAWGVSAARLDLFLVRADRAQFVQDGDESEGVGGALFSGAKLAAVGVADGAFLLARVLGPPAATSDERTGGGNDSDADSDADDVVTTASPLNAVSDVVGPIFESEARSALGHALREVCPWFASISPITTRLELTFGDEKRQADLFSYCAGDSLALCSAAPEAGVYVVWPDASLSPVVEPALPAAAIGDGDRFSPADASRHGPHKYFVGEAYSGANDVRRREKVRQLETEVEFLMRRFADRSGLHISDVTSVIGAAAIIFPAEKGLQRSLQVSKMQMLVRENAGPHLLRLARAGRLLLVLLSLDQAPLTAAQRDTAVSLRQIRTAQNLQARQLANQLANQLAEQRRQLAEILERLSLSST